MDITLVKGTFDSLKAASDIAKSLLEIKKGADITAATMQLNTALIDAQSKTLAIQADQQAAIQEISELKQQIVQLKAWNGESEKYALIDNGYGGFAFALKEHMSNGQPPHLLCASCYQDTKKSILNSARDARGITIYTCPSCNSSIKTGYKGSVPVLYAEQYENR